jgi:dTDP-4-dehydrorhamnose reductase
MSPNEVGKSGQRPRFLVTGCTGQVGWELLRALAPIGEVVAPSRTTLDITDEPAVRRAIASFAPDIIVNAAAWTAVDDAEREPEEAMRVNAAGPRVLAEEAERIGALLVHYSTDYVFDGTATTPYDEDATPDPLNVYGASKLAGERAIEATAASFLILRTSWVYGLRGRNFLRTVLRLANDGGELRIVDDQVGVPCWSRFVADATAQICGQMVRSGWAEGARELLHISSSGQASWYDFALAIVSHATHGRDEIGVTPIRTAERTSPAARPAYSVLDAGRAFERFGVVAPDWREMLSLALEI